MTDWTGHRDLGAIASANLALILLDMTRARSTDNRICLLMIFDTTTRALDMLDCHRCRDSPDTDHMSHMS
jgi:hypothetical protein